MTAYKVVVFDLWDTLLERPFRENLYQRLAGVLGCSLDQVIEVVRLTWFRDTKMDRATFARRLADYFATGDGEDDRQQSVSRVEGTIADHEENETNPHWIDGAYETLQSLQKEGVRLVLVSNATVNTRRLLGKSWMSEELVPMFDEILLSCEVGFTKPDPRLLLASHVVRKADSRQQVCIIGDQFDTDILAAQILGFDSILLRNPSQSEPQAKWQMCRPRIARAHTYSEVRYLLGIANTAINN